MNPIIERLTEERKKWRQDTPNGFSANPTKQTDGSLNLFQWECEVPGPRKTPWEGSTYRFSIKFDKDNLNKPLLIKCISKCFHPNVAQHDGFVCSSLNSYWPTYSLKQIILSLQSFLEYPDVDSPMNREAANLYKSDKEQYDARVRNLKGYRDEPPVEI